MIVLTHVIGKLQISIANRSYNFSANIGEKPLIIIIKHTTVRMGGTCANKSKHIVKTISYIQMFQECV